MVIEKKERQTKLNEFKTESHQIGIDGDAYSIISTEKKRLFKEYKRKRTVTYSDTIRKLKERADINVKKK